MLNQTRKFLKMTLPIKIFIFLKKIYGSLRYRSLKYLYYNENIDLETNEKNLINLSIDKNQILNIFKRFDLDYNDDFLSWHYHLLAGLSKNSKNLKILEIGTHIGHFTKFISEIYETSTIYSIDLKRESKFFQSTKYNIKDENESNQFLKQRSINLNKKNIKFIEKNSFELLNQFDKEMFDIIWLDGDHTNPQVSMDVISAYYLLKKNGILLADDIFLEKISKIPNLLDTLEPIKYLTGLNKLKTYYFTKRINRRNAFAKKFISFSIKI